MHSVTALRLRRTRHLTLAVAAALAVAALPASADTPIFQTGDLVVSSTFYQGNTSTITAGVTALPSVTQDANKNPTTTAITAAGSGSFTQFLNNNSTNTINATTGKLTSTTVDANFGITSQIVLSDVNATTGAVNNSITLAAPTAYNQTNGLTTSFPSKSELALNLSSDGTQLTFMGYLAPVNSLDVSNSNTPGVIDPTNTDVQTATYRAVGQIDSYGHLTVTATNAYSGNNGRAAVLINGVYYMVGNGGNGNGVGQTGLKLSSPNSVVSNTGVQMLTPGGNPTSTVVGTQYGTVGNATGWQYGYAGLSTDKSGKSDNFRGLTVYNNTIYTSKGSGSNGVNTVFQVGAGGTVPATAGAAASTNITILPGLPTTAASAATAAHPFGMWFANATTLYVADEGDGTATFNTDGSIKALGTGGGGGLQKWVLNTTTNIWSLAYTLTSGLALGQTYSITGGVNADGSVNASGTGVTVKQATDGLRNLTGKVNSDGTVTLYAITSTVSASGDQGADPNKLVAITDVLSATTAGAEAFTTLETATLGQALRGVSLAPSAVPLPAAAWLMLSGLGGLMGFVRRSRSRRQA